MYLPQHHESVGISEVSHNEHVYCCLASTYVEHLDVINKQINYISFLLTYFMSLNSGRLCTSIKHLLPFLFHW